MMRVILSFLLPLSLSFSCLAAEFTMDFVDVPVKELVRLVYGEFLRESYIIDGSVGDDLRPVTLKLKNVTEQGAELILGDVLKGQGLEVRRSNGVVVICKRDAATSPKQTIVYRPKYRSTSYLQQAMASVFEQGAFPNQRPGNIPFSSLNGQSPSPSMNQMNQPNQFSRGASSMPSGNYMSGANSFTEYDSDVLVFQGSPDELAKFNALVYLLDQIQGEVLVKAIVYEVKNDHKEGSAIDLMLSLLSGKLGVSFAAGMIDSSALSVNFKTGSTDISAIYSALSSDGRFKVVSSPRVRVRSGSTAKLMVGDEVPILGSVSYDGEDRPIQSVEYKSAGVIFELTPKVRDRAIDLRVNQQISSFIQTTTGVTASPTLTKRELSTELSLSSDEVVVIGGLEMNSSTDSNKGLSFFPGWLRSDQSDRSKSEILLMLHVQRI